MKVLPTRFLFRAEHGRLCREGPVSCWLCGGATPEDAACPDDVIRSTYSDHARARKGGEIEVVCEACEWYFDHKILRPGGKRGMGFYTKSILVWPDRWDEWLRENMAADLLHWMEEGLPQPAILALNYSKQKHVIPGNEASPAARVNPAGTHLPWIATDTGQVAPPAELPDILAVIGDLWRRGYPKSLIAQGVPGGHVLRGAEDPGGDISLHRWLARWANTPEMDLCTYIVTEENRDHLARGVGAVLQCVHRGPAAGGAAPRDSERRRRAGSQVPVPAQVVADARGASKASRPDGTRPGGSEQLDLLSLAGNRGA